LSLPTGRRDACATFIVPPEEVCEKFKRVKPLKEISVTQRGWTLDVLNIVRRISEGRATRVPNISGQSGTQLGTRITRPSDTFTTAEVYAFERELEKLHPDNSESFREQAATSAIKSASNCKSCVTWAGDAGPGS
jgi:hypothetical protein